MASNRLNFILDGRDGLSRVLDRAGDNAVRLQRRFSAVTTNTSQAFNRLTGAADRNGVRLTAAMNANQVAVRRFTTDANGRLRDLNGRFVSTGDGARRLQGDMNRLQGPMRGAAAATGEASAAGGSLTPVLYGVAGVLGVSLLPALGALVPMMAGAGLAAGTLKLGFAGISDAVTASGEDQKKYAEELKKLSPEARTFTKEVVGLKKEFGGLGKDIQKVMLPGFTRALKDAKPVIDLVGGGMVELGKGFGDAAAGAGKLFKSGGFQRDLKTNMDLGMQFVHGLSGGFGTLVQSLLAFGAKSGPTLKSFTSGLGGLLGKGLPGMFKGLETGIGGAAKFLDGFFSMINKILPAIGRFSGEVARSLGPLFGEMFKSAGVQTEAALDTLGQVVKGLTPVFKDLGFGIKAVRDLMGIFAPVIKDVGSAILGSLLPSFSRVDEARGPLQRLSDSIKENKGTIQEVARIMGTAFITIARSAIENLPKVIGMVRLVTGGMVTAFGGVLHAAASSFGWIPGIGDKLRSADREFGKFKDSYMGGLAAAERKTREFADGALPKLSKGELKMNINSWNSQLETAKAKLKTVPPSKQAKLRADIADLQNKIASANRQLANFNGRSATAYIDVQTRYTKPTPGPYAGKYVFGNANGGLIKGYASGGEVGYPTGGHVRGPGTETSDSILTRLSNNEYVIKARSVAKYGVAFMDALNEGRLSLASGIGGGGGAMVGAGQQVGHGLSAGMLASADGVGASARRMAAAVTAGVRAELEIASPSKKMKALMADVGKGIIIGLTGTKAKISATAKDLVKDIWKAWEGVKTSKDSKLVQRVNADTKKLLKLADQRDVLAARIVAAKKYASDLTGGARKAAELDQLGMDPEEVTAGGIKAGLAQKLSKLKTFTSYINMLAKKGLNKSLLRQILDMGPEAGYAYASALAGADKTTFNSINSLETQLNHGADTLGRTGADAMYDSGKNAAKGFLRGLTDQQKAIEAQMLAIAKGMQKAIKKALGIKSPSTVMAQLGRYSTEGLAAGLTERMPVLDRALGAVTGRVASAQPVISRPAVVGGGAGATVINLNIEVRPGGVADWQDIQRGLLSLKRAQGGNVSLGVG